MTERVRPRSIGNGNTLADRPLKKHLIALLRSNRTASSPEACARLLPQVDVHVWPSG